LKSSSRTGLAIAIGGLLLIGVGLFAAVRTLNIGITVGVATPTPTPPPQAKTLAAVAANDITEGTVLESLDIKLIEVPVELAPRDVIANLDNAVGRISKTDLIQGEMILEHNLANPTGQTYDIAYILDDNHVLMALGANDLMSSQAMIKRGDIVDILVTYQSATYDAYQRLNITAIIIDIVQGSNQGSAEGNQASVGPSRNQVAVRMYLVALDPQNALVLKYLRDAGAIFDFVLRAPTSTGQFQLTPVTAQYIVELYGLGLLP
jgi:Flp pilus assembly protein CpaB